MLSDNGANEKLERAKKKIYKWGLGMEGRGLGRGKFFSRVTRDEILSRTKCFT